MDDLPCEILLAILERLTRPADLAAAGLVARWWHEVASDDRLWKALLCRRFPKWIEDVGRFVRVDPDLRPDTAKDTLRMLVACAACGRVPPMVPCGRRGKDTRANEALFEFDGAPEGATCARLCGPCMNPDAGGAATKTDVKKRFMLNDGDLDALPYAARHNPHYSKAWPMLLYIVPMAERVALRKFGSYEGFDDAWQKREAAATKRRATIARRRTEQETAALAARKEPSSPDHVHRHGRKRGRPD